MSESLAERLQQLPPAKSGQISALRVTEELDHRVGLDEHLRPVALISSESEAEEPGFRAHSLILRHAQVVDVQNATGEISRGQYSLLTCTSPNVGVQRVFIDSVEAMVSSLPSPIAAVELSEELEHLFELFEGMSNPSEQSAIGLWGELFFIAESDCPERLAQAWHVDNLDVLDFVDGDNRYEVKTTRKEDRVHSVSERQVRQVPGTHGYLISIQTGPAATGTCIEDLLAKIEGRVLDSNLKARVRTLAVAALGSDWPEGRLLRFDEAMARATIASYPFETLPTLAGPIPPEISGIRYSLSLEALSAPSKFPPSLDA